MSSEEIYLNDKPYFKTGPVLKMDDNYRDRFYRPDSINADELSFEEQEAIALVCAENGLQTGRQNSYLISLEQELKPESEKKNYSKLSEINDFIHLATLKKTNELYFAGHKTVFDLVNHYYAYGNIYFNENFESISHLHSNRNASLTRELAIINDVRDLMHELAKKAPLQVFYTHHIYQRYMTSVNMGVLEEDIDGIIDHLFKNYDLFAICNHLVRTESDFFDVFRHDPDKLFAEAERQISGLSEDEVVTTHSGETNGYLEGELVVPKPSYYDEFKNSENRSFAEEQFFFPSLFDKSSVLEIYEQNSIERSYLLSKNPELFEVQNERMKLVSEAKEKHPLLDEKIIEIILRQGNYSVYVQPRIL
jgi:hypothetical protein